MVGRSGGRGTGAVGSSSPCRQLEEGDLHCGSKSGLARNSLTVVTQKRSGGYVEARRRSAFMRDCDTVINNTRKCAADK